MMAHMEEYLSDIFEFTRCALENSRMIIAFRLWNLERENLVQTMGKKNQLIIERIENEIDLIITHHPFIFDTLKSIDFDTYDGQIIKELIKHNICLYSMHTSFDMAESGVNSMIAEKLNIKNFHILHTVNEDKSGYGGISDIEPINIIDYANYVKEKLNCASIKLFCADQNKIINKVAFCGGSGSEFIQDSINKNADVYITGDIKYHQAQHALKNNLSIIDAGHYNTECHSLKNVQSVLKKYNLETILLGVNTVAEILI
jgi:dinuclear metal center YbgI/SA1388 family protein